DHFEDDVARCKGGRGPQPYMGGRDDESANQDDWHKAPADERADSTPKPVSQKRRDYCAAIREEDCQEEPTQVFHGSRSRTIRNGLWSDHRDRGGPDNNRSQQVHLFQLFEAQVAEAHFERFLPLADTVYLETDESGRRHGIL